MKEPPRRWLNRIATGLHTDIDANDLYEMLAIHNKLRFDPVGITGEERVRLDTSVQEWLKRAKS